MLMYLLKIYMSSKQMTERKKTRRHISFTLRKLGPFLLDFDLSSGP
jgi:hypothetical protein